MTDKEAISAGVSAGMMILILWKLGQIQHALYVLAGLQ